MVLVVDSIDFRNSLRLKGIGPQAFKVNPYFVELDIPAPGAESFPMAIFRYYLHYFVI